MRFEYTRIQDHDTTTMLRWMNGLRDKLVYHLNLPVAVCQVPDPNWDFNDLNIRVDFNDTGLCGVEFGDGI